MISYAQNLEDVVLNRVFQNKPNGFYIDVGAHDPIELSVTKHFYDLGWHGVNIEPVPASYEKFKKGRPDDINLKIAVGSKHDFTTIYEIEGYPELTSLDKDIAESTGKLMDAKVKPYKVEIRTLTEVCEQYCKGFIDFIKIDVEGFEKEVILGTDLKRFRPTMLVVEATKPCKAVIECWDNPDAAAAWHEWEPLLFEAEYVLTYYDGLNRYYLRKEDEYLKNRFVIPVTWIQDQFSLYRDVRETWRLDAENKQLEKEKGDLANQFDTLTKERSKLLKERDQLKNKETELVSENEALSAARVQLVEENGELNRQILDLNGAVATLENQNSKLVFKVDKLAQKKKELENHLQATNLTFHSLQSENSELHKVLGNSRDCFTQLLADMQIPLCYCEDIIKTLNLLATIQLEHSDTNWFSPRRRTAQDMARFGICFENDLKSLKKNFDGFKGKIAEARNWSARNKASLSEIEKDKLATSCTMPCKMKRIGPHSEDSAALLLSLDNSSDFHFLWDKRSNSKKNSSSTESPLVSVVTVVLNADELIEKTIKSVVEQNYPNIEYIVIDGGSTDKTLNIIRGFKDKIDAVMSEPDKGIYDAMNKGIDLANGEWTIFLNAGDTFYDAHTIETVFNDDTSEFDIIYGDTYLLKNDGSLILEKCGDMKEMWKYNPFYHQSVICKTILLKADNFNRHYKIVSDSEFIYKQYIANKSFLRLDIPISVCLDGGLSRREEYLLWVERWKMALDFNEKPDAEINRFYLGILTKKLSANSFHQPDTFQNAEQALWDESEDSSRPTSSELRFDPVVEAKRILESLPGVRKNAQVSGTLSPGEKNFLLKLIFDFQPEHVLELGVASGDTTAALLMALKKLPNKSCFYALDKMQMYYVDETKEVGFVANEYISRHGAGNVDFRLLTKKTALDLPQILDDKTLDFALIDAHHSHPWPTLDTICILPCLREGILIYHDTALYHFSKCANKLGPQYLFDQFPDDAKIRMPKVHNIGAVRITGSPSCYSYNLASSLLLPWKEEVNIPEQTLQGIRNIIIEHYDKKLLETYDEATNKFVKSQIFTA